MKIAVISDTHWQPSQPLPKVLQLVAEQQPDLLLHAGDWTNLTLLEELRKIAPVRGVAGNCDPEAEGHLLGYSKVVEAGPLRIGLTHAHLYGHLPLPAAAARVFAEEDRPLQAVVFGHSHVPYCEMQEGLLLFNPGSAHRPLGEIKKPSFGLLHVSEAGQIKGEIVYFEK